MITAIWTEEMPPDEIPETATFGQLTYIDNLMRSSTLDEAQLTEIDLEYSYDMEYSRASEIITMLLNNQEPDINKIIKDIVKHER